MTINNHRITAFWSRSLNLAVVISDCPEDRLVSMGDTQRLEAAAS